MSNDREQQQQGQLKTETHTTIATSLSERLTQLVQQQFSRGKSIAQIAAEVGYQNPNMLEMLMQGHVKVPLDKAYVLARALGENPATLFRQVLRQYWRTDDTTLDEMLGEPVSDQERDILHRIRALRSGSQDTGA